ncbi:MAG: retropepsin-like aspartic protease family protein [Brasilonema sp.]
MPQFMLSRAALILLSTTLAVLTVACHKKQQVTVTSSNEQPTPKDNTVASPVATTAPLSPNPQPQPTVQPPREIEVSYFEQALDKAVGALSISQSAQSTDDWNLVVAQLADAIALMKKVPVDSPYFTNAQAKILDYQRHLRYAIQKATRPVNPPQQAQPQRLVTAIPQASVTPRISKPTITPTPTAPAEKRQPLSPKLTPVIPPQQSEVFGLTTKQNEQQVYTAPIKRRIGGTPIIEVTFNGTQPFEMILDTGASGTVITQKMANALGVVQVGRAKANTANSRAVEFPIGYVDSMEVDGARVNRVAVAIAGVDLETGLLGHDFFGDYDITIKRDIVEFRPQSHSQMNSTQETEFTAPTVPKTPPSLADP